ncbi:MAG: hypothetical protein MJ003_07445 [Paludibacteraceae bacterium]|nr:hypothetical protein [Paludibacteraceae bacterium]
MKKITVIVTALTVVMAVLVGCEKKSVVSESKQSAEKVAMTFYAYPQGSVRTGLIPDDVLKLKSVWTENDEIVIFTASNTKGSVFSLTDGVNTDYGTFEGEAFKADSYAAAYPVSMVSTTDGSTMTFVLPNNQTYKENTYETNTVPVVAYTSTDELYFDNVTGMLRVGIKSAEEATITKMVLKDKVSSFKLWGTYRFTPTSTNGLEYVSGGDNAMELKLGAGVKLKSSDYTYFYFCLPVGALATGLTVDLEDSNGRVGKIDYAETDKVMVLNHGKTLIVENVEFKTQRDELNCMTLEEGVWMETNSMPNFVEENGSWD